MKAWSAAGDWLDAADPGALRRLHAARSALAALTAWLAMRMVVPLLAHRPVPAVGLFAVTICFIGALVIVDARRTERRLTLLLSIVMFAVGLLLAAVLPAAGWLYPIALLILIFASYTARRRGLRAGELLLVLTMGLYFAEGIRVTWGSLALFLLAAVTGVASLWLWQFVILPYDPARSLHRGIRAFSRRAAAMAGEIGSEVEKPLGNPTAPAGDAAWESALQRHLRQVKLSRHAIEGQFPGALAPGGWTEAEIGKMQLALYTTEQGLAQMVEGAGNRSHLASIPAEIRTALALALHSLQEALNSGSIESMQTLAVESAALQVQLRAYAQATQGDDDGDPDTPLSPWVASAVRLVSGSHQVAQSARQVVALRAHTDESSQTGTGQSGALGVKPKNAPLPPLVRVFGNRQLHPTTALGIQAVVATGLAMGVARLLNMDHANWVFWTAFVVIAGTTGESLRKMMLRVVGTVAGAAIGVGLALLTPDNTILVVGVATACIFLTIYFAPTSYPQMVFWLNLGFVMVYARLGAQELDLLFERPGATVLGALIAALVVVFVVPIHITDRFKAAVAYFLDAVDGYVTAFVEAMTGDTDRQRLDAAQAKVAATYAQVEKTLPGVAFENSPLLQAQSPLTQRALQIAGLEAEVARLANAASEHTLLAGDSGAAGLMRTLQARIHGDIQALIPLLNDEGADKTRAPSDRQETAAASSRDTLTPAQEGLLSHYQTGEERPGQFRSSGSLALLRIHGIITRLAAELGAPVQAPLITSDS